MCISDIHSILSILSVHTDKHSISDRYQDKLIISYVAGGDVLNIHISYDSEKPMYEQIEEQIKEAICNNEAKDNEPLPSVRQLSTKLNVSAITIKRAYADLEKEGFIYTMAGKGTFVKLKHIDSIKGKYTEEKLDELREKISKMKKAGISKEEIITILEEIYN